MEDNKQAMQSWVAQARAAGLSDTDISTQLAQQGWRIEEINSILSPSQKNFTQSTQRAARPEAYQAHTIDQQVPTSTHTSSRMVLSIVLVVILIITGVLFLPKMLNSKEKKYSKAGAQYFCWQIQNGYLILKDGKYIADINKLRSEGRQILDSKYEEFAIANGFTGKEAAMYAQKQANANKYEAMQKRTQIMINKLTMQLCNAPYSTY